MRFLRESHGSQVAGPDGPPDHVIHLGDQTGPVPLPRQVTVTCVDGHGWPHPTGLYASDLLAGHGSGLPSNLRHRRSGLVGTSGQAGTGQ